MGVPCPCHWCTNGLTLVWLSDVPHRPLLIWYAHFMNCYGYYDWFVGAYGCILDLLFVSRDISWFVFGLVTDVCAIHVFHIIWEWQLQPLRYPLMLLLVFRGHPSGYIIFGLIWFGLVVDYYSYNLYSCSCFLTLIFSCIVFLHNCFVIITCYLYICSLGFLSSAAFLFPRQVLEGSWVMGEECK